MDSYIADLTAEIEAAEARIEALEEALRRFGVEANYPDAVPVGNMRAESGEVRIHIQGIGYFFSRTMSRSGVESTVEEIHDLLSTGDQDA